jgi:hypothetical protein
MNLEHLASLTDDIGLFEHCLHDKPRKEHGYCVDDVARGLIVLIRADDQSDVGRRLVRTYSEFLAEAQLPDGRVVNRRDQRGDWHGVPSAADHWGRALWAWGNVVRHCGDAGLAAEAYERFRVLARRRSIFLRSMVFASLGASQVLEVLPGNRVALGILEDTIAMVPPAPEGKWAWPESRLTYANGAVAEAMMVAGYHTDREDIVRQGRYALDWLWRLQSTADRLSIISHAGWMPGDSLPAFDQQPIEVAALVDASLTAFHLTSDPIWTDRMLMGRRWFEGWNDQGIPLHDPNTGAGFDALTQDGRNENRGAESTIAFLGVDQRTESLVAKAA